MNTKKFITFLLIFSLLLLFSSCNKTPYDTEWIIGKTSAEIEERYGEFYQCSMPVSEDGLYRNCRCSLVIKESRTGFLGTDPAEVLSISFDENGIAYKTSEELGDWGG
ncbi:MAG: hypothetical protein IJ489_12070 [Clostridia bacterium]|nr:hypothetical protein [Clostridia bacterium]